MNYEVDLRISILILSLLAVGSFTYYLNLALKESCKRIW